MPPTKSREEVQALIDENAPLMQLCSDVAQDLFRAERAKAIYLWISDQAGTINDAKFGLPFGIWQEMALVDMFVCLGRAYDEERQGETHCIRRIVLAVESANLIDRDLLIDFVAKDPAERLTLARCDDEAIQKRAARIIQSSRPTFRNSEVLQRVLSVRHNEVAHRSHDAVLIRPTFADVDHCLDWGKQFIGMVGKAFGSHVFKCDDGGYWSDFGVKSALMGMRRLTHRAGIVVDPKFVEMESLLSSSEKPGS